MSACSTSSPGPGTRGARRVIALAARIAPGSVRAAFHRQWNAELEHRRLALAALENRPPSPMSLLAWSAGSVRHALWLRGRELDPGMLTQDLGYALRNLRRNPMLSLVAAGTLAIGIGATTALFSIVNGALLRPLPYPEPDRLVMVHQIQRAWLASPEPLFQRMGAQFPASYPIFQEWRQQEELFDAVAVTRNVSYTSRNEGVAERIWAVGVSGDLPRVLGVSPAIGRWFQPDEDALGGPRLVVLSHAFWQERFGGDSGVVGRALTLDEVDHEIVGVMPAGFSFPDRDERLWVNLRDEDRNPEWGSAGLTAIARLRPGVELTTATERLESLMRGLAETNESLADMGVGMIPRLEYEVGEERSSFLLLLGAAGLLLLIACANVSSLLLVRGSERRREVAVRIALGAGRGRVLRQFLAESVVLGIAAGVAGALIAYRGAGMVFALLPAEMRVRPVDVDLRVLLFALLVAVGTGLFVGLVGCADVVRTAPARSLAASTRVSGSRGQRRTLGSIVVAQVALAMVLLVGASLMATSLQRLMSEDRGFDASDIVTLRVDLPADPYEESERIAPFVAAAAEALAAVPGIAGVAITDSLPFGGSISSTTLELEGAPTEEGSQFAYSAIVASVDPGHFPQFRVPLLAGRLFTEADNADSEHVLILNEAAATAFFPGEDPLGKRMRRRESEPWARVVGVVGNVRHAALDEEFRAIVYSAFGQRPEGEFWFTVRGLGDSDTVAAREAVASIDPSVPVPALQRLEEQVRATAARPRARTILMSVAALLAVTLAMIGVYGAIAYSVRQRTREIGVRIAVGARTPDVVVAVLRWGMTLAVIGVLLGLGGSLAAGRVLASFLYGVEPSDPLVLWAAGTVLLATAALACIRPAWRASRTDPTTALRAE